jgi:indoleamine 2,3-dioxygenase
VLEVHDVHPERGFLPSADPITALPAAFSAWEELAAELPKLLGAGRVRRAVADLPPLSGEELSGQAELNRAMLLLSYLGHAYVFGDGEPADHVPAALAKPWHAVASALGRPPVLSYASHALYNWRRLDPDGPIELGNIARLENFLGGLDEDWFVLIHVAIEATAGPGLAAAVSAQHAAEAGETDAVTVGLSQVEGALGRMLTILRRMPEKCDPYIYYHRVRQFIFGWMDNPALPDGIWYDGVDAYHGQPRKFRGETGAQSSIIPAFDAMLGIDLGAGPLGQHVIELRAYMPPPHRDFLDTVAQRTSVRQFVLANTDNAELVDVYNRCVLVSAEFRQQHLEYAGDYIRGQRESSAANPVAVGTGGTPFMTYLSQHQRDLRRYLVDDSAPR